MATYELRLVRIDGERILFDDATLSVSDGRAPDVWEVHLDGARVLHLDEHSRTHVVLGTAGGETFEGEAEVGYAGHRDEEAEVYYGVELDGLGRLEQSGDGLAYAKPHTGSAFRPKT